MDDAGSKYHLSTQSSDNLHKKSRVQKNQSQELSNLQAIITIVIENKMMCGERKLRKELLLIIIIIVIIIIIIIM